MEKFCPTKRVEGNRIVLGEPVRILPETPAQSQVTVVTTWKALLGVGILVLASWGISALVQYFSGGPNAGTGR